MGTKRQHTKCTQQYLLLALASLSCRLRRTCTHLLCSPIATLWAYQPLGFSLLASHCSRLRCLRAGLALFRSGKGARLTAAAAATCQQVEAATRPPLELSCAGPGPQHCSPMWIAIGTALCVYSGCAALLSDGWCVFCCVWPVQVIDTGAVLLESACSTDRVHEALATTLQLVPGCQYFRYWVL